MKEHPIIFSGEMVQAILEGRKTQTRRVIKPQPALELFPIRGSSDKAKVGHWRTALNRQVVRCPYGIPGDLLWVRETIWREYKLTGGVDPYTNEHDEWETTTGNIRYYATDELPEPKNAHHWWTKKPSIHTFREESRITLEVVSVRVERVQEISEEDAKAEGVVPKGYVASRPITFVGDRLEHTAYRDTFHTLWNSINAKRGYSWQSNPWVWVVEFRQI